MQLSTKAQGHNEKNSGHCEKERDIMMLVYICIV